MYRKTGICRGINKDVFPECVFFSEKLIDDINNLRTKSWTVNGNKRKHTHLLTLFTSFDAKMEDNVVYSNMLNNWKSLDKMLKPFCFSETDFKKVSFANDSWRLLPVPKLQCGSPVLKDLFLKAFQVYSSTLYGYVNADIFI